MLIDNEYAGKFLGNPGHLIPSLRVWLTILLLSQFLCCVLFPPSSDLTEIVMTIIALSVAMVLMTGWVAIIYSLVAAGTIFFYDMDPVKSSASS